MPRRYVIVIPPLLRQSLNPIQNAQPAKKSTTTKKATEKTKAAPARKSSASNTKAPAEKASTTKKPSAYTKKAPTTTKKAATVKKPPTKKTTSAKNDTKKVDLSQLLPRQTDAYPPCKVAAKAAATKAKAKSTTKTTKTASAKAKPRSKSVGKPASKKVWNSYCPRIYLMAYGVVPVDHSIDRRDFWSGSLCFISLSPCIVLYAIRLVVVNLVLVVGSISVSRH